MSVTSTYYARLNYLGVVRWPTSPLARSLRCLCFILVAVSIATLIRPVSNPKHSVKTKLYDPRLICFSCKFLHLNRNGTWSHVNCSEMWRLLVEVQCAVVEVQCAVVEVQCAVVEASISYEIPVKWNLCFKELSTLLQCKIHYDFRCFEHPPSLVKRY